MVTRRRQRQLDPITFEVLNNSFKSIVDEMGALIQTVAFSIVVSEGRDYSGTICNADGDLVSTGSTDLPGHLGTIPFTVKGSLEWDRKTTAEVLPTRRYPRRERRLYRRHTQQRRSDGDCPSSRADA